MPLRRMSLRRRKAETEEDRDGCPRDGRCFFFKETDGAEIDGTYGRQMGMSPIWKTKEDEFETKGEDVCRRDW